MADVIDFENERARRVEDRPRTPPHDLDAEAAIIASMLLDSMALSRMQSIGFRPEHMYSEAHRWIATAGYECARDGRSVDVVTVANWLKDRDRIAQVGGLAYITELLNSAPATTRIEEYATIVYEKHRAREVIAATQRIAATGYLDYGTTQAYADEAARTLGAIAQRAVGARCETNIETLSRLVNELRVRADEKGAPKVPGLATGFKSLDRILGGLHAGWKVTVCSLSNVGKTAFGMQVAVNVARLGIGVQAFITEASRDEWFKRAIAQTAQVDIRKITTGKLSDREWSQVMHASSELGTLPIWIDATTDIHIGQVRAAVIARAESAIAVHKVPLGLVIVDHVHRLEAAPEVRNKNMREQLKHATETLKKTLKQLKIPGLELAQMRDNPIDSKTKMRARPGRGFVAECRYIERESDAVLYLHQQPLRNEKGAIVGEDRRTVLGILDKVRSPDNTDIEFGYVVEESRFVDEKAQVDDRIDPMVPPTRSMMNQPDPRLPPERDEEPPTFNTDGL